MDMVGAKGTHFMSGDKQRVNMGKGKEGFKEGREIKKEGEVVGKEGVRQTKLGYLQW